MAVTRCVLAAMVCGLVSATPLAAQGVTGSIAGRVVDSASQQVVSNATISIEGTQRGTLTRNDGGFLLRGIPAGTVRVRAARIGYAPRIREVTVTPNQTVSVEFELTAIATTLSPVVTVGYGTQRREAVTGAVASIEAKDANVGVSVNANALLTARVSGVQTISNNGEPGGAAQIRVRGGTSISASNEPLYVIDGVPLQNENSVAKGPSLGNDSYQRSPLNSLNPSDISSITVLKDASATAIYGSRGANGVVLIETKRGSAGPAQFEYETYVAASQAANSLNYASANQYRTFVQARIADGSLPATAAAGLGTANTDWEKAVQQTGITQNHNFSFMGGSANTRYRATLNYFDQQGVIIENGLKRYQGRINASNSASGGKLQSNLNLTVSRVENKFLPFENGGGFTGGVFTNVAIMNPTKPIYVEDPVTHVKKFYELGAGSQSDRNPVALARQLIDEAPENRILGNFTASYSVLPSLTARTTVGADYSNSVRQTYWPLASPVGVGTGGLAKQAERSLQNLNFQGLLTWAPHFNDSHDIEVLGGYEFTRFENRGFEAQMQGFLTDAFQFNNLGAGTQTGSPVPVSYIQQSRLVSFFSRANYSYKDRYFLTGVLRNDGSSRLAPGHKWQVFPAISGSWRLSQESFMKDGAFSNLSIRFGYGLQGNQAVGPYQTQLLLGTSSSATYPFGGSVITGFGATQVANPDLKWETSTQANVGVDWGIKSDRITGTLEFYQKKTKDLLFRVPVAQPAVVSDRLENVGSLSNTGFEASVDAELLSKGSMSFSSGLVFSVERNKVDELGLDRQFINVASVNGQGQSGRFAQRLIPGQPVGTFWGPVFAGLNSSGQQTFNKYTVTRDSKGRELTRVRNGTTTSPGGDDEVIIGNANPNFSLGFRSNGTWKKFDASWLWRAEVGRDVFNNTALVYSTTASAKQGRNFMASALSQKDAFGEPAIYSSRWIESGSFIRLQNVTVGYTFKAPTSMGGRDARVFVSGDNLLLSTPYSGYDPEVFTGNGVDRGVDYLIYPRARTFTGGLRISF